MDDLRKFFDGLNIFIIVEYFLRVGVRFVHCSLLLLYLVIYLVIYLFTQLVVRITCLFLFIFSLALISHLILCILCTICYKPN